MRGMLDDLEEADDDLFSALAGFAIVVDHGLDEALDVVAGRFVEDATILDDRDIIFGSGLFAEVSPDNIRLAHSEAAELVQEFDDLFLIDQEAER